MDGKTEQLTAAEWNVMECLWASAQPLTGGEAARLLAVRVGWSRTTVLTMLRRMEKKGLIACDDGGKKLTYRPLLERSKAVRRETESFLSRVYRGSVGELMHCITQTETLSDAELDALYAILDEAKERRT